MTTTIKVPVVLRDRINREAQERGLSAAGLIEKLLDGYERRRRMEAFGRAFLAPNRSTETSFGNGTSRWERTEMTWLLRRRLFQCSPAVLNGGPCFVGSD